MFPLGTVNASFYINIFQYKLFQCVRESDIISICEPYGLIPLQIIWVGNSKLLACCQLGMIICLTVDL